MGIFRKIRAFTLAEILITLGIIGIVAAITIPMLITNYQKRLTLTRLQKHYAQLNQVIKLIDEEHGLAVLSVASRKHGMISLVVSVVPLNSLVNC